MKNLTIKVTKIKLSLMGKYCLRCGKTKFERSGGCSAWGTFWKRHLYDKTKLIHK